MKRPLLIAGIALGAVLLVCALIMGAVFVSIGESAPEDGRMGELHPCNPAWVTRQGRLASVPKGATDVRCEAWNGVFTGDSFMAFSATAAEIEQFIASSPSLQGQPRSTFAASPPAAAAAAVPFAPPDAAAGPKRVLVPRWYSGTASGAGYRIEIHPGERGHNFGFVTVDQDNGRVFVRVTWD